MSIFQSDSDPPSLAGLARLVPLVSHANERGCLLPLEFGDLPFVPRRVFTVSEVPPGTVRGGHGHRMGEQLLVCLQGRVEVLLRRGPLEAMAVLLPAGPGLLVPAGVWCRQTFVDAHSVLLVLASEPYDPASYFEDWNPGENLKKQTRIAVLGAGIMGCALALYLARRGAHVALFDAAPQPFTAASRWNEGKIHLGHLYSADPSLRTADHVLPGGLLFRPLVEDLLATSLDPVITREDDVYLCHRKSVVSPDAMEAYMRQVTQRVRAHPDARHYLADASRCRTRRLTAGEMESMTASPDILAGFRVPERSVQTPWIADRFVAAVAAESRIEAHMNTRITAVRPLSGNVEGAWQVETMCGAFGPYDYVVNALWQGRMAIDATAGLPPQGVWTNRYRQSLFLRTREPIQTPCVVIATGPFGDIKNYNGRDFYLSWYPDGLRAENADVAPPDLDSLVLPQPGPLSASILEHLEALLPWVARLRESAERMAIEGGWVFAAGGGQLSDPSATLHRRSEYGVVRLGGYVSVDTGKYSTAPWLARTLARQLA